MDAPSHPAAPSSQDGVATSPQNNASAGRPGTPLPLTTPFVEPLTHGAEAPAAPRELPTIGRYRLLRVLGRGGMGVVYLARDEELGREVALKMIRVGTFANDEDVVRFRREAHAAAQLDHPNIVRVYEIGQHEGEYYFTLSVASGGNLTRRLGQYRGDARAVATLMEKVARGVQHAHEHGILHRDLKPGNILLDAQGEPLISDFGLAKLDDSSVELTRAGAIMGTPAYMAPEQAASLSSELGPATDVWALGVILYELYAGRRPFAARERHEVMRQVQHDEPTALSTHGETAPRDLQAIILHCLEKRAGKRYASAGALADDLRRFTDGEPVSVRPPGAARKALREVQRRPWLTATVSLLALAAATALGAWFWLDPERPTRDLVRRVERGEAVVLVPEAGAPKHLRTVLGAGEIMPRRPGDPLLVGSSSLALFELLPRGPAAGFRFRAEVRQQSMNTDTRVGIYALHHVPDANAPAEHVWVNLAYNERVSPENGPLGKDPVGATNFSVQRLGDRGGDHFGHELAAQLQRPGPFDVDGSAPWRLLSLVVTPHRIEAKRREPRFEAAVTRPELLDCFRRFLAKGLPNQSADFAPSRGVGLYVERGSAQYRNVVVEPLE